MRKGVAILTGVLVLVALAAAAASAATPDKTVVSFDDPALEAAIAGDLTKACHTPISVDLSGKVEITVVNKTQAAGALEVDAYETRGTFTNVETGTTASLVDVGPDVLKYDAKKGTVLLAITGRSITGSV